MYLVVETRYNSSLGPKFGQDPDPKPSGYLESVNYLEGGVRATAEKVGLLAGSVG
jgi:hypothetical protein